MNHCQTKMHPSTCSSDIQRSIHGKQTTLKRREAANKHIERRRPPTNTLKGVKPPTEHIERREAANEHMKTTILRLCFSLTKPMCSGVNALASFSLRWRLTTLSMKLLQVDHNAFLLLLQLFLGLACFCHAEEFICNVFNVVAKLLLRNLDQLLAPIHHTPDFLASLANITLDNANVASAIVCISFRRRTASFICGTIICEFQSYVSSGMAGPNYGLPVPGSECGEFRRRMSRHKTISAFVKRRHERPTEVRCCN